MVKFDCRGVVVLIAAGGFCLSAGAEPPTDSQNELRGPKVEAAVKRGSLVERDFDGRLRRLEISPEEAAVPLLRLDEVTRAKVDKTIAERSLLLDLFVRDNLDLLLRFSTANASGNKQDQGMLLREAFEKAEPIRQHGRLLETVGAVLSTDQKKELTHLVQEYREAQIAEQETADRGADEKRGKKPDRVGAMFKIGLEQFGQDVKRAYERVISEGQGKLNEFVQQLNLNEQQEANVRKLTLEFAQAHIKTPATSKDKTVLFLAISAELEPEQRGKLLKYVQTNK